MTTDDERRRTALKDLVGSSVMAEGFFCHVAPHGYKQGVLSAIIQNIDVTLPNGSVHTIGHCWVQEARTMKDVPPETAVKFKATVREYYRQGETEPSYGLAYPRNIEVVNGYVPTPVAMHEPEPVVQKPVVKYDASDTIVKIAALKGAADAVGGIDAAITLLKMLKGAT